MLQIPGSPALSAFRIEKLLQRLTALEPALSALDAHTRFVPRSARADTPLWPDDRVVIFSAIVGG